MMSPVREGLQMRAVGRQMRPVGVTRIARARRRSRKDGRSWRGGLTGFGVIATCFALTCFMAPNWVMEYNPFSRLPGQAGPSLEALRAGSIFITSMNQDTCRQRSFDNASGRQWDFGTVDCRLAILATRQSPVADRMNAITDAFRQK
jgi:hypothetical protein